MPEHVRDAAEYVQITVIGTLRPGEGRDNMTAKQLILAAALALVAGFGSAKHAVANPLTNSVDMLSACEGVRVAKGGRMSLPNPNAGICIGFIAAIQQASTWAYPGRTTRMLGICAPLDGMTGQWVQTFVKFGRDHPELLKLKPADVAWRAFAAAWPCASKQPKKMI
jgi:hypothetical protein